SSGFEASCTPLGHGQSGKSVLARSTCGSQPGFAAVWWARDRWLTVRRRQLAVMAHKEKGDLVFIRKPPCCGWVGPGRTGPGATDARQRIAAREAPQRDRRIGRTVV